MLWFMGSQRVGHDCTELNLKPQVKVVPSWVLGSMVTKSPGLSCPLGPPSVLWPP